MQLREAAGVLGVHYQTAYAWVRQGVLPARKTGRGYDVSDSDVSALAERRACGTAPRQEIRVRDWAAQADRLYAAIVTGDETQARHLFARLARGVPLADLCERVIAPALDRIGDEWAEGRVPIAAEHRASAICERLIAARTQQPHGRPRGVAVTATPPGERHALPALMATACLREDRWLVHHLSADLPVAEVTRLTVETGAGLVVLSATTAESARAARLAADEIMLSAPGVHVLTGQRGEPLSRLRQFARETVLGFVPLGKGRELVALFGQVSRGGPDDQARRALGGVIVHVGLGHVDRSPARDLERVRVAAGGAGGLAHQVELAGSLRPGEPAAGEVAVAAQAGPAGRGRA
jgi:excisionase family DNA binding protein